MTNLLVRVVAVTVAVLSGLIGGAAVAAGVPSPVSAPVPSRSAAAQLPPGWSLTSRGSTDHLTWRGGPAAIGDAQLRFFAGNRLLGLPRPAGDGRGYTVDLPAGSAGRLTDLKVVAGGRRLDQAGVSALRRASNDVVAGVNAAVPALPLATVDPGRPGPFGTTSGDYILPTVKLPDYPQPVEMRAVVVSPVGVTGARPLALFLHGRHSVCYGGNGQESWPCPAGTRPIPSYRGYLRAQKLLASQGYVTVSIAANGINAQDFASEDGGAQARSSLIRLHLNAWADWAGAGRAGAPAVVRRSPVADLSKVLLMGHSRGGEGVNRAAMDSLTPPPAAVDGYRGPVRWQIRGTLQLAPTLFGHDPVADVPSVVVLPGCDGDVYDLQGQITVDGTRGVSSGTALHSAVFVVGANHNYFNSEWTPGLAAAPANDDWFESRDAVCGTAPKTSLRLTPVQQQRVGAVYIAAAARQFIRDDDRVLPLLDGSGVRAESAGPARVLSHAVGGARTPFILPAPGLVVQSAAGAKARRCQEVLQGGAGCLSANSSTQVPSFVPFNGILNDPDRSAVKITWTSPGGRAVLKPATPISLATAKALALRVIVPPGSGTTPFDIGIADASGRRVALGRVAVTGLPGTRSTVGSWAQELRIPMAAVRAAQRRGFDITRITELRIVPRTARGQAYLLDAWGWRAGSPPVQIRPAARIDVGAPDPVAETDGSVTYQLPVAVSGTGSGRVRVFTQDFATGETSTRLVTVPQGARSISVPVSVLGDTVFGPSTAVQILARAVSGTVVGDYQGLVKVTEDDPAPAVTVTAVRDAVTEGGTLSWRFDLSAPVGFDLSLPLTFIAPPAGPELSTTDVPQQWVFGTLFTDPLPSRPLSASDGFLDVPILAGATRATFSVPTVKDAVAESVERVQFELAPLGPPTGPATTLSGSVTDAP